MAEGRKILLVDDDDFILDLLEVALTSANYVVVKCRDGQQAIDEVKKIGLMLLLPTLKCQIRMVLSL